MRTYKVYISYVIQHANQHTHEAALPVNEKIVVLNFFNVADVK